MEEEWQWNQIWKNQERSKFVCKFDNGTEKQHLPTHTHTQNPQVCTTHNLSWSSPGWNHVGKLHQQGTQNGVLICYLRQAEKGIKKLSDYKLNQEVLRHEITQKLFTLINDCICKLWDMGAGASPEVLKIEVLQGFCAYLEY